MATMYTKANAETERLVTDVAYEIHAGLASAGVTIGVLWADGGLKHGGIPAAATVRITGKRERALGQPDAVVTICRETWDGLTDAKRRALIDHEAAHLLVQHEKEPDERGKPVVKLDDSGRPKLKMRKHDCEIGFFFDVVERHGAQAMESGQFLDLHRKMTQLAFPWG